MRCDAKQLSRAFAIAAGDDRCMNVNETALLKKLVNGKREPAAHAKDATEKIRPWTQMRDLAQKLRRVPLFLERIAFVGAHRQFRSLAQRVPIFVLCPATGPARPRQQ